VTRPELRIVVAADRYRGSDPMRRVARDSDATTRRVAGSPNVDAVAVSIDRCSPSPSRDSERR